MRRRKTPRRKHIDYALNHLQVVVLVEGGYEDATYASPIYFQVGWMDETGFTGYAGAADSALDRWAVQGRTLCNYNNAAVLAYIRQNIKPHMVWYKDLCTNIDDVRWVMMSHLNLPNVKRDHKLKLVRPATAANPTELWCTPYISMPLMHIPGVNVREIAFDIRVPLSVNTGGEVNV